MVEQEKEEGEDSKPDFIFSCTTMTSCVTAAHTAHT